MVVSLSTPLVFYIISHVLESNDWKILLPGIKHCSYTLPSAKYINQSINNIHINKSLK